MLNKQNKFIEKVLKSTVIIVGLFISYDYLDPHLPILCINIKLATYELLNPRRYRRCKRL